MAKFKRVNATAFLGAGNTDAEARANQVRRIRAFAKDMEEAKRTDDVGVQTLFDGDPGGGGPCEPDLDVADVRLDVPLPEAEDNDDDD